MTAPTPTRTAEVRWFFAGALPAAVDAWFDALGERPPEEARTDAYLPPTDDALGVKWRPSDDGPAAVESKRREAIGALLRVGHAAAPVETWVKWSLPVFKGVPAPEAWVAVDKTRWQHRDGAPEAGCALELSRLTVHGADWWSVAMEATAPDAGERAQWLLHAATRWLGHPDAPALATEDASGYPEWLRRRVG